MAKLNARGRTELLRIVKEKDVDSDGLGIMWQRWTRAYMSDSNVLEKYDVRFKPSPYDPKGKFHSFGWKRKGKMLDGTLDDILQSHVASGWKVERT